MSKKDDTVPKSEAPTPRATERTVLGLDTSELMLKKIGDRPGQLYDRLRREFCEMIEIFSRWPEAAPTSQERIEAVNRLSGLMKQVYALDERSEPSEDPESS